MYSLVMLTAMASGADPTPVAQPVPIVRSNGCIGSCYGSCSGCFGSGCNGCYGSCHGARQGHGLFGHHKASCHGCTGNSCSGWSCFGSCHGGCTGMRVSSSCHGCYGGCWGPASPAIPYSPTGSAWNYGPGNIYANPYAVYGVVNYPPVVVVPADVKPMETPVAPKPKEGTGANLKFNLPVDAILFVDGRLTMIGGTERTFTTPPLAAGQKYYYDVKAELTVNGKTVVEEKRIIVEAGANINQSFPVLVAALEGKSPKVAGN
jgi:uncharacterized protein (TIGR03000 family)